MLSPVSERKAEKKIDLLDAAKLLLDLNLPGAHLAEQIEELGLRAAELAHELLGPYHRVTETLKGRLQ